MKHKISIIPKQHKRIIQRSVNAALKIEGITHPTLTAFALVSEAEIMQLNASLRHINEVTDVLSFPDGEWEGKRQFLGDIALCLSVIERQAAENQQSFEQELQYMVVHSMLHLLGYDHIDEAEDKQAMRAKEKEILRKLKR